jgi:hypothetical protein
MDDLLGHGIDIEIALRKGKYDTVPARQAPQNSVLQTQWM